MTRDASTPELRLAGMTALVTGGAHGIGRAYAQRLASEGASVVVADLDGTAAASVAKALGGHGFNGFGTRADIADPGDVGRMVAESIDRFGRIDILVNNAAMMKLVPLGPGSIDSMDSTQFERILKVNVVGTMLCIQAVVPDLPTPP